MKKKSLNQLKLKKKTVAHFESNLKTGGFIYPYSRIKGCNTYGVYLCPSDPIICFTADCL